LKVKVAIFCHSLVSDWNHGNAHFLRGVVAELQARGHEVNVFEPREGWSRQNLLRDYGSQPVDDFQRAFPGLCSTLYDTADTDWPLDEWLDGVGLVLVHEWNDPKLVAAVGRYRKANAGLRLFFHDTHHRAVTAPHELARFDLSHYDGVLAYGASLRDAYRKLGWGKQVHVWHEAADICVFRPIDVAWKSGDLVWIGNWGDGERTAELREYFIAPAAELGLKTQVFGVRYPAEAIGELSAAGISYGGWLPNHQVPATFAQFKATVHVPRRPYTQQLPGIPTIRPFEALACGIPLVSAPWEDTERLFRIGTDFLMARNGHELKTHLRSVLNDKDLAASLVMHGLETIRGRHTCAHRVDELLDLFDAAQPDASFAAEQVFATEMLS